MNNIEIGRRIKEERDRKGMSLQDIADLTGVARSTVQRYETGRIAKIKLPVIESIARSLGVRPEWIIGKTESPYSDNDDTSVLLSYYELLNTAGKNIATEQVRLLTLDQKYTCSDSGTAAKVVQMPVKERLDHRIARAARNDHIDEPGELEKTERDTAGLQRPNR